MVLYDDEKNLGVVLERIADQLTKQEADEIRVQKPFRESDPPARRKPKQKRNYIKRKSYKRGVCGKCGKEGHSAWKCPDRKPKKKANDGLCFCGRPAGHRGIHRGGHLTRRKKMEKRTYQAPEVETAGRVNELWDPHVAVANSNGNEEDDYDGEHI